MCINIIIISEIWNKTKKIIKKAEALEDKSDVPRSRTSSIMSFSPRARESIASHVKTFMNRRKSVEMALSPENDQINDNNTDDKDKENVNEGTYCDPVASPKSNADSPIPAIRSLRFESQDNNTPRDKKMYLHSQQINIENDNLRVPLSV